MIQEEKQLLLIDLCARLPHGVKVNINSPIEEQNSMELFDVNLESETIGVGNDKWAFRAVPIIDDEDEVKVIKPYLRPMSSMTEKEYNSIDWEGCSHIIYYDKNGFRFIKIDSFTIPVLDYLNAWHFDFRYLIEKGLALEAKEGMYKTE